MDLILAGASRWSVLFTEQVLDELSDWGSAKGPKNAMTSLLVQSVPAHGPQEGNSTVCKPMAGSDHLYEFRKGESRGPKVRVLWFYGDPQKTKVICVRAFVKTFQKTPPEEIAAATKERERYFQAREAGTLNIVEGTHLVRRKR